MNIEKVAFNLSNTIAGKEQYLKEAEKTYDYYEGSKCDSAKIQYSAVIDMLKINIAELKLILVDVQKCLEKATQ